MKVVIKYGDLTQEFENQANITIGNSPNCDIIVSELGDDEVLKLVYAQKYNNYVLMNVSQSRGYLDFAKHSSGHNCYTSVHKRV